MDTNLFSTENIKNRLDKALANNIKDENEIKHLVVMYKDSLKHDNRTNNANLKENSEEENYISASDLTKSKSELKPVTTSQSTQNTMNWAQHKDKIANLINERNNMLHDDILSKNDSHMSPNTKKK